MAQGIKLDITFGEISTQLKHCKNILNGRFRRLATKGARDPELPSATGDRRQAQES